MVYLADQDSLDVNELYSISTGGLTAIKLNSALPAGGEVLGHAISADSTSVVYRADQDFDNKIELYSAPIGGGELPTKLNATLPAGGDILGFAISADATTVVYHTKTLDDYELSSVPIGGGHVTQLHGPIDADLHGFEITPDSSTVVYHQEIGIVDQLYSVPIVGGPVTELDGPFGGNGNVEYEISADSSTVVFSIYQGWPIRDLYSAPIDGGDSTNLSDSLGYTHDFVISSESTAVVYTIARQGSDAEVEIVRVGMDGSAPTTLNPALGPAQGVWFGFAVSADSSTVVFRAILESDGADLYSIPLAVDEGGIDRDGDGVGGACDCNDSMLFCHDDCTDGDLDGVCLTVDCDDSNLLCGTDCNDGDGDGVCDDLDNCLDDANPNQSWTALLNAPIGIPDELVEFVLSPDGTTVAYRVQDHDADVDQLFGVGILGGPVTQVDTPPGADIDGYEIGSDNTTVVYRADPEFDGTYDLYRVSMLGGPSTKLNSPLVPAGTVWEFGLSPDGSHAVYRADQDTDNVIELYSVNILGGPTTKLNSPFGANLDVLDFRFSPDGSTVVYRADQETDQVWELFSVPIGGGVPVKLNPTPVLGGDVQDDFAVSHDGLTVLYRADLETNNQNELYQVPIGGGQSTKLNGSSIETSRVFDFSLSPDGTTVVYRANQDVSSPIQLFSVPIGAGTSTQLNGVLVEGGNVLEFAVSPDGSRVAYKADQDSNGNVELYGSPIGGGSNVKLSVFPPADDGQPDYGITPDGLTVVYRGDPDLYSVPIEGGPVTTLNHPLPSNNKVWSFLITTGETVLYRAGFNWRGLYSVPALGGVPVTISESGAGSASVPKATPDESKIVFSLYVGGAPYAEVELYTVLLFDADGADNDHDGFGGACDCNDQDASCADCFDGDADGLSLCGGDCDDLNPNCTTDCTDQDGDGYCVTTDCNESNGNTFPGAPETNDGIDNQCPGEAGHGLIDELSGPTGFFDDSRKYRYFWTPQAGATDYQIARADSADFTVGCTALGVSTGIFEDDFDEPVSGAVFHYMVRPFAPNVGSWGPKSDDGTERNVPCAP